MVQVVPGNKLTAGVYWLVVGEKRFLFAVGSLRDAETGKCIDISYVGALQIRPCSAVLPLGSPGEMGQPMASAKPTASTTACADYDACFQAGINAFLSSD